MPFELSTALCSVMTGVHTVEVGLYKKQKGEGGTGRKGEEREGERNYFSTILL